MRLRVHGFLDERSYLVIGRRCAQDIQSGLERIGRPLRSFKEVLDFGCGCGRIIGWLPGGSRGSRFRGTDVDGEAVEWCQRNIRCASFDRSSPLPPLPYPEGAFDLILAISVFTHLNEPFLLAWLAELRRVTAIGGVVVVTVSGEKEKSRLTEDQRSVLHAQGVFFERVVGFPQHPEWYGRAFHSQEHITAACGRFFTVLEYLPEALNQVQDILLLRRDT